MAARDERALKETTAGRLKEIVEILARYNLMHGLSPEKLLNILEDMGPTFVKLGQIMSMRSDMIPEEYCRELTKLRAEVRPMSFAEVMAVLEGEYGEPVKISSLLSKKSRWARLLLLRSIRHVSKTVKG